MTMKFLIYSKFGCPFCIKLKRAMEIANLQHEVYMLDENFDRNEFYAKFGHGSTFPQVVLNVEGPDDGTRLGGCTETIQYLRENKLV